MFMKEPHTALLIAPTGVGKTHLALNLLENEYRNHFDFIVIITYKITDISLEYEIITQPDLARSIRSEYQHMALLYDRILRHRKIKVNKADTVWNWAFNMPCKSLKGILWFCLMKKSHLLETRASSTILAYKKSL